MILFGLFLMLSSAGVAGLLGWENRHVLVHVRVAHHVWTTHLYTVLTTGALLACWFLLGASFIQCRLAERRHRSPRAMRDRPRTGQRATHSPA